MVAVNYLWNPLNDNIVREFDDGGVAVAEYTTEPHKFGNVISQRRSETDSYLHFDGIGSTLALTGANGGVTDTRDYTAFGESSAETGATEPSLQYVGRSGYFKDSNATTYYVRRRALETSRGVWLAREPLYYAAPTDKFSGYDYVHNKPLRSTDPSGLIPIYFGPRPRIPWWSVAIGHGNYCGFRRVGLCTAVDTPAPIPAPNPAPFDALDAACLAHDCCLFRWYHCINPIREVTCNFALCNVARSPTACFPSADVASCLIAQVDILRSCQAAWL